MNLPALIPKSPPSPPENAGYGAPSLGVLDALALLSSALATSHTQSAGLRSV